MNSLNAIFGAALLAFTAFALARMDAIPYKDCGSSPNISIAYINISDCTTFPCIFKKNTNITADIKFVSNEAVKAVDNLLYGIIAGVKVPFPIPQADACSNGLKCPLVAGNTYQETILVPIDPAYPQISVYVIINLIDDQSNNLICAIFPAKITS